MTLLAKIKEAHSEGLIRYEKDYTLLNSPLFWFAATVNKVIPGTVDNIPPRPHPLTIYYRPTLEYFRGFYETLKK